MNACFWIFICIDFLKFRNNNLSYLTQNNQKLLSTLYDFRRMLAMESLLCEPSRCYTPHVFITSGYLNIQDIHSLYSFPTPSGMQMRISIEEVFKNTLIPFKKNISYH